MSCSFLNRPEVGHNLEKRMPYEFENHTESAVHLNDEGFGLGLLVYVPGADFGRKIGKGGLSSDGQPIARIKAVKSVLKRDGNGERTVNYGVKGGLSSEQWDALFELLPQAKSLIPVVVSKAKAKAGIADHVGTKSDPVVFVWNDDSEDVEPMALSLVKVGTHYLLSDDEDDEDWKLKTASRKRKGPPKAGKGKAKRTAPPSVAAVQQFDPMAVNGNSKSEDKRRALDHFKVDHSDLKAKDLTRALKAAQKANA